ncbi:MAG: histidine phosphatase family protein, partial [Deltaproteobacteria bacterium]|nr:histidine phosphatase family protein [Deltaproteobacteria bacterium]
MALYLVQHGRSLPKDVDPDQGLSDQGLAETKRIAEVARNYQVNVLNIKQSGKKRARQTAEIFAAALNPAGGVEEVSGLKPLDDVTDFAASLD